MKKSKPSTRSRKPVMEVSQFTTGQMADFLVENVPELREAFTRADIELALDDRGWLVPGRQWTAADLDAQTRTTLVAKARLYWLRDPLCKQAVRLWTDYSLGTGVTWDSSDPKIKKKLDEFAKHPRNKTIMNSEGQRRSSKKLLVDGELFFAVFDDDDDPDNGIRTIRRIDCLQMTDIITDPDDEEHILGYARLTAQDKKLYYADYRCTDDDLEMLAEQPDPSTKGKIGNKVEKGVQVYHLPFDTLLKRGNGLLSCVLDWSKEHRRFLEARVAIVQGLAKFATKIKVKGGQGILNQLQAKLQSTYATAGMTQVERHPQTAPGGTWLENAGMDLQAMPRATGSADAMSDGRMIKHMHCAGTGIMEHYYGDGANANLATATAMELPMLKQFQSYQQLWTDAYEDIFSIACSDTEAEVDLSQAKLLTISVPPILLDDVRKVGQFVKFVADVFPEIRVPEVLRVLLNSLNISNIDDVMEEVENYKGELELKDQAEKEHQLRLAKAGASRSGAGVVADPNVNKTGGADDPKGRLAQQSAGIPSNPESGYGTTEADRQIAALNRLAAVLEEAWA